MCLAILFVCIWRSRYTRTQCRKKILKKNKQIFSQIWEENWRWLVVHTTWAWLFSSLTPPTFFLNVFIYLTTQSSNKMTKLCISKMDIFLQFKMSNKSHGKSIQKGSFGAKVISLRNIILFMHRHQWITLTNNYPKVPQVPFTDNSKGRKFY